MCDKINIECDNMYNLDYENIKRKNFKEHAGYFASVVFTLFMFACFLVQNEKIMNVILNYNRVTISNGYSEITEVNIDDLQYTKSSLHYKVKGKEYKCSNYMTTKIEKGLVFYKKNNPSKCATVAIINIFFPYSIILMFTIGVIILWIKAIKKQKKLKKLLTNGKLIKNLKYKILGYWTGTSNNRHYIQKFEIDYTFPSGTKTKLYSNPIEYDDIKEHEKYIDMIYDPNDITNHYIDYNINRKTGNTKEDYDPLNSNK